MKKTLFLNVIASTMLLILLPACWGEGEKCTSCGCHGAATTLEVTEAKSGLIIANVLDREHFDDCHIKGSINVPFEEVDKFITCLEEKYGSKKDEIEIVVYCSNYMCSASGEAAKKILAKGFTKVRAYEAGMAEWFAAGLPVEGSCKKEYLTKKMMAPEHEDALAISTQELAQKFGLELSEAQAQKIEQQASREEISGEAIK